MVMKLMVVRDYDEMSERAADIVSSCIREKKNAVLGLATGASPVGLYKRLAADYESGKIDFSAVRTFNLDEYVGLDSNDPRSYHSYMRKHLFDHVNLVSNNIHIPRGDAGNLSAECEQYEGAIRAAGGIDLQVLGIGRNGHIGFNEPGASFDSRTHVVELAPSTRQANARYFSSLEAVPQRAISMGLKTIGSSRRLLLLAYGEAKADAIRALVEGETTEQVPATLLQKHKDAIVLITRDAAAKLSDAVGARMND